MVHLSKFCKSVGKPCCFAETVASSLIAAATWFNSASDTISSSLPSTVVTQSTRVVIDSVSHGLPDFNTTPVEGVNHCTRADRR